MRPAANAPVDEDFRAPRGRIDDLRKRLGPAHGAVELAPAVIRHDDRRDAVLEREQRVFSGENPLHHQRQRRDRPDPVQRIPRETGIPERVHIVGEPRLPVRRPQLLGGVRLEVLERHAAREMKSSAHLTLATAQKRHVHRHAHRRISRRLGALHQRPRDFAIAIAV